MSAAGCAPVDERNFSAGSYTGLYRTAMSSYANLVLQGVMLPLLGVKLRPEAVSGLLRYIEV